MQKNNNINKMATPKQTTSHVQRVRESGKTAHKRNIHTNCTKKKKTKITVSKTNNMSTYIKIKKERLYRRERKRVLFV